MRSKRNMGMPPSFEELTEGSYARNGAPFAQACSSSDMSKDSEDVSLPDSHALLHVTNRRKTNTMVTDSTNSTFELLVFYLYKIPNAWISLSKKQFTIFCYISDCYGLTRRNQIKSHPGW